MSKHKSEDYKLSTVKYYLDNNNNQLNTCKIFKCSPRSLMRWIRRYTLEHSIKRHNRLPMSYKIKKIHIKFILSEIIKIKQ
jgi:transposase-like protein